MILYLNAVQLKDITLTFTSAVAIKPIFEYFKVQYSHQHRIIHAAEAISSVSKERLTLEKLRVSKRAFLRCVMHIVNGTHRYMCSVIKRSDSHLPNGH